MKEKILKKLYILLAYFARNYLKKIQPFIIGITWSVGKTSCRVIISQVLQKLEQSDKKWIDKDLLISQFSVHSSIYTSPKNFNSEIWLILSVFEIEKFESSICNFLKTTFFVIGKSLFCKPKYKTLVLEYGIDHPWDMAFLLTVAVPDIAIFTKLDKVHDAYFNDLNSIWDEKFKLILSAKKQVYLNVLDDYCKNNTSKIKVPIKFYFWWNIEAKDQKIENIDWKIISTFNFNWEKITTNLFWEENLNYVALWLDIAKIFFNNITTNNFFNLDLQPGRFSIFQWINNSVLIDSTYNAAPESMIKMIKNTNYLRDNAFTDYKLWFVIWDMRELWSNSEKSHKELANSLLNADFVVTVWIETMKYLLPELDWRVNSIRNYKLSKDAWIFINNLLLENKQDKFLILFKWSQNTIFTEEALKEVLLNELDKKALVRQSNEWLKKK